MKFTKKIVVIVLAIVMVLTFTLIGCSDDSVDSVYNDSGRVTDDTTTDSSTSSGSSSTTTTTPNYDSGSDVVFNTVTTGTSNDLVTTIANIKDSVVEIYATLSNGSSAGSGVIVSASDNYVYILTCNHVVENAVSIEVVNTSGDSYNATFVGGLEDQDIAVIKIAKYDGATIASIRSLDDAPLQLGETTIIIGNPLGILGGSVSTGIISGLDRTVSVNNYSMNLIQTDAAVNSGNSGGAVFDENGSLIGIINAKATTSSDGTTIDNIAFAIPIDWASEIAASIISTSNDANNQYGGLGYYEGKFVLGITTYLYTGTSGSCFIVTAINEYGFLADMIQVDDQIYEINGITVTSSSSMSTLLSGLEIGDTLTLKLYRKTSFTFSGSTYTDIEVTATVAQYVYGYVA